MPNLYHSTTPREPPPGGVYPLYILSRVAQEILHHCQAESPKEALGVLIGRKFIWQGHKYVKITDWATGHLESGRAHAKITKEGVQEYYLLLADKYGETSTTHPKVLGLYHSHPFGTDPRFSSIDLNTFFSFPYNAEYNTFILIEPTLRIMKCFLLLRDATNTLTLHQVDWVEYQPCVPHTPPPLYNDSETKPQTGAH